MNYKRFIFGICITAGLLIFASGLHGEDWLTYQHDYSRSGVTSEQIGADLGLVWRYESRHLPRPAWPEPAENDYYHSIVPMRALVVHDKAFHVVISGGTIYFGSSADDQVYALDTATGQVKWTFFTGGPIRIAPTVVEGRLYVGSDDGCVYCISAKDGSQIWKYDAGKDDRILPGNERMISILPVRAGLIVDGGRVYFSVGLFPNEGTFLVAVDAADGSQIWKEKFVTSDGQAASEQASMSGQGYMLASAQRLYVPAGRVPPMVFSKDSGKYVGAIYGIGGAYAGSFVLLTAEGMVSGPGGYLKGLHITNTESIRDTVAVFGDAVTMVVKGDVVYVQTETTLSAFNRKSGLTGEVDADKNLWSVKADYPYSMIMAGDIIYSGSSGKVTAYNFADGKELWSESVDGTAYGLAAANGKLFATTDKGKIYCYGKKSNAEANVVQFADNTLVYPDDKLTKVYTQAAKRIVEQTGIKKGYCLDVGCGKGRLALELAKISDLQIIGIDDAAGNTAQARKALDAAGVYGRVAVMQGNLSDLHFNKYLFNLIVSDQAIAGGAIPANADEVLCVLRPCGGTAYLGRPTGIGGKMNSSGLKAWASQADNWKIIKDKAPWWKRNKGIWITVKKEKLEGAGQWTHQYADPGNSSNAGDKLITADVQMQWFGRPGPGRMADRHSRTPAPLSINGRLFVCSDQYLYGVDAYNGTILWEKDMPEMQTRINMPQDNSYMVADEDYFYAAVQDKCRKMDGETGEDIFAYEIPVKGDEKEVYDWGYLAYEGDTLYGSAVTKGAFYTNAKGPWYDAPGSNHDKICSDFIFALDIKTGELKWRYDGLVVNSTIAIGGGKIYFVQSRNAEALKSTTNGRLEISHLGKDMHLVALDALTGKGQWESTRKYEHPDLEDKTSAIDGFMAGTVVFDLCYSDGKLVLLSSPYREYSIYAFNAADGEFLWKEESNYRLDGNTWDHGGHMQHPVIIDGVVYQDPHDFDLHTGKKGTMVLTRDGHSCGSLSGSPGFLFGRGSTPRLYDLTKGGKSKKFCAITRPGCWINIICANGLVLMPEASSGCACAFPIQTSMAFAAKDQ